MFGRSRSTNFGFVLSKLPLSPEHISSYAFLAVYALVVFSGNKLLVDTLQRREEVAVYDPDLTATQAQDIPR
jgi:hypothetical protein